MPAIPDAINVLYNVASKSHATSALYLDLLTGCSQAFKVQSLDLESNMLAAPDSVDSQRPGIISLELHSMQ